MRNYFKALMLAVVGLFSGAQIVSADWATELTGFSVDMAPVYLVGGVILAALGGLVIYRLVRRVMGS